MKKLVLLTLAASAALSGCATTGYGPYDNSYGYYDQGYYRQYGAYDYNRPDPRYNGYYADRYYRNDSRYRQRVLSSNDRIYRGQDGRYYCRRSDGSTGLVVGALAGGVAGGILGNLIAPGGSNTVGTVIGALGGAAAGAAIGNSADNDKRFICR
jgi:hypothetical protein